MTFNNITEYDYNYQSAQHVLGMITTFLDNVVMCLALTSPALWTLCYWGLIVGEGLTALLLLIGALRMWAARDRAADDFDAAKDFFLAGVTMGFLVWFVGFMVVGGEWSLMWASGTWNGQEGAFHLYLSMLPVLIFVNQPERT